MLTKLLEITALHDLIGKYYATPVSLKNTLLQGFMLFQILHYHRLMSRLSVNKSSELQCNPDMQLPAEMKEVIVGLRFVFLIAVN